MIVSITHYKSHHNGSTYLVSGHFSECLLQFLSDRLELLLLGDQFVLQPVHLLLQLHHRLLRKLGPGHRLVQLGGQSLDLFLEVFSRWFAFSSATSRDFRLLATTLNSSSRSTILVSPTSALSSAFSRSDSH